MERRNLAKVEKWRALYRTPPLDRRGATTALEEI
jgi:hypothetical protein